MRVTGFTLKEAMALISHKVQAQAQVFIVNGTDYHDGIYAEEGEGINVRHKRMGGEKKWGKYSYLYGGTERFDTWVVGYGTTFEGRIAKYRVPAGGAGDQLPPEEG